MKKLLAKLIRGWNKLVRDRIRYGTRDGYDAEAYWGDRLHRAGTSLTGPGHEGISEEENQREYAAARILLESLFDELELCRPGSRVVEIGPGTGFWTAVAEARGITDLQALDITDVRFPDLKARFPQYDFVKGDAASGLGVSDAALVMVLDVIEHVVSEADLTRLLTSAVAALRPGGVVAVSFPPPAHHRRNLFYLRFWDPALVASLLAPCSILRQVPFRDGILILARKA